jgi:putative transposase
MLNAFVERFNRTFREEVLDFYVFSRLDEVSEITENWLEQYNEQRPYEALGYLTPAEYFAVNSPEVSPFDWH